MQCKNIKNNILFLIIISLLLTSCKNPLDISTIMETTQGNIIVYDTQLESLVVEMNTQYNYISDREVSVEDEFEFATYSVIKSGKAILYDNQTLYNKKDITVCVNAGHGTKDGSRKKTFSHPDFSPKIISGTTSKGSVMSSAVSVGTTMTNKETEAEVVLKVAMYLKDILLANGYSVLMIRETDDVQLDNIARTVLANNYADIHVSLHFDSDEMNKGTFYIKVPQSQNFKEMYPVSIQHEESDRLGENIIQSFRDENQKIFSKGYLYMDLTQMSYSTIPNVDIEIGSRNADISKEKLHDYATYIYQGIEYYYNEANKTAETTATTAITARNETNEEN